MTPFTSSYRATIGLEVHVQLDTRSKMFCGCRVDADAPPNSCVCPVCLGYPGALPVMNRAAIEKTVRAGLMLGCDIRVRSNFDRKSYFYPDMPKNYQITQYDRPLCLGGAVDFEVEGAKRSVRLKRIHLEEDTGKNMHFGTTSGVDFNRAGTPLMEIVTEPEIHTPEEAYAFLTTLRQWLLYAGVSRCNMEQGNLRCDVNCSVLPAGVEGLGTKAEIKNLNTFKGVQAALAHEIARQADVLRGGGAVAQETRRWDAERGLTASMRGKEDAHDYRYFPDPDLMPVVLEEGRIAVWRAEVPENPSRRRERLAAEYGLPVYDAGVLAAEKAIADFYEAAARGSGNPKAVSNWIMTEMLRLLSERQMEIGACKITPGALAELVQLTERATINSNSAKEVFAVLFEQGGRPADIVTQRGLAQVNDTSLLETYVEQAIAGNAKSVADYRSGKAAAAKFLVGQVMRLSKGTANPQAVMQMVEAKLKTS